jgi:hypothetical protein
MAYRLRASFEVKTTKINITNRLAPMILSDNRVFDEADKPESSRTVSEGNGNGIAERESTR